MEIKIGEKVVAKLSGHGFLLVLCDDEGVSQSSSSNVVDLWLTIMFWLLSFLFRFDASLGEYFRVLENKRKNASNMFFVVFVRSLLSLKSILDVVEFRFAAVSDKEVVVVIAVADPIGRTLDFMEVWMRARMSLEVNIFTKKIRNP